MRWCRYQWERNLPTTVTSPIGTSKSPQVQKVVLTSRCDSGVRLGPEVTFTFEAQRVTLNGAGRAGTQTFGLTLLARAEMQYNLL